MLTHTQSISLALLALLSAVAGQAINECSAQRGDGESVDCSPVPLCMERAEINRPLQPIPPPLQNHYQCYETCSMRINGSIFPRCEARVSIPNARSTEIVSGPFHLRQYSVHQLRSPQTDHQSQLYPNNHLCKYHVACREEGAYLSVTLTGVDLEPNSDLCQDKSVCRDSLRLHYPTGSECTLCGSEMVCRESGRSLPSLLVLNGRPGLHVTFSSNRGGRGCGFRLLATCTSRTFFESSNCSLPDPLPPPTLPTPFPPNFSKRDVDNSSVAESNDTRSRRYFNQNSIVVPEEGKLVYLDLRLEVKIGGVSIHIFPGVAVLQVYNDIEGSLTFYGSSNGRSFPGYGVLSVGLGIVHYTQESVPSQFKPMESEERLIQLLHRAIEAELEQDGAGQCAVSKLTQEERSEVEKVSLEYGNACNGFLRAASCAYQQLHMTRVTTDCLTEVPFLPFHQPPTSHPPLPLSPNDQSGSGLQE